ncbi:MAG TPA: IS30 family transposase [Burkholderiaceae bacterium]|nr:IS30 family transposase [Burkholderiaceae bacterium]
MAQMGRPGLTAEQRAELWRRWKAGESMSEIGRALERHAGSIHSFVSLRGGIAPPPRCRSASALTPAEREEISRGIASGESTRAIARRLRRAPSTVCREIGRNGGRARYRASESDSAAWDRARRPKDCCLAVRPRLRRLVASKLSQQWSPEQIAGWLERRFPDDDDMHISHETIYRSLYIQARGVLKKELVRHLRTRRVMRRAKRASTVGQRRGQIVDAVSIRERPPEVEDRAIPGHWEGDLITGSKNSHVATLVERRSRFTMLVKLEGKETGIVTKALARQVRRLPDHLRKSLTWDRGPEMARHREFSIATDVEVYFCDPQSPWQRGTNENTNRLVRQYLPKSTDLSTHSQADLDRVARLLNGRPRKTLGFQTPAEALRECVALTA